MAYCEQGYNILIVDDHQLIIDGLTGILKEEKLIGSIQSAINGQEAIERVMNNDIDCVLMDINMPLVNGYEATKIIKKQKPHIKVVIISMLSDDRVVEKLLKTGADAFMVKDIDRRELLEVIEKVMHNEKYISPELNFRLTNYYTMHEKNESIVAALAPREIEIIRYIEAGISTRQIAEKLSISISTVDTHLKNILAKLGLRNAAALRKYVIENGLPG
jgi:DNA-binding NarL/FixJ family response regulator